MLEIGSDPFSTFQSSAYAKSSVNTTVHSMTTYYLRQSQTLGVNRPLNVDVLKIIRVKKLLAPEKIG